MKKRIALYGKGGIGKTTVAVNTALCMARRGYRVLLVGCDPKQDRASPCLMLKTPYTGLQRLLAILPDILGRQTQKLMCSGAGSSRF